MREFTQEQKQAIDAYGSLLKAQAIESWAEFDALEAKHYNGEICFIRWPHMTLGDMNDKAAFYAERDAWNATTIGASD